MSHVSPRPRLRVDHAAIAQNYRQLQALCPKACAATIKADAYGLGLDVVSDTLIQAGCDTFFVATLDEALTLRGRHEDVAIYIFEGFFPDASEIYLNSDLRPVMNTIDQVSAWGAIADAPQTAVHIDTGMNRLGLKPSEFDALKHRPDGLRSVDLVMSHFACADTADHALNRQQLECFHNAMGGLAGVKTSLANSAGIFLGEAYCGDIARPGIALYGGNPMSARDNPMRPVITLTAPILQVHTLSAGDSVGYGASFVAQAPMKLATIGMGYADGLPRGLAEGAYVMVAETPCPILGRISMDLTVIDVSAVPEQALNIADEAELIGAIRLEQFADWSGTLNYEVLTRIGPRVERAATGQS